MATTFNVHEAKTNLSRLLDRVEKGEEIVIARSGQPVAKLTRIQSRPARRNLGRDEGKVWIAENFDEWTEDLEKEFFNWNY